MKRLRQMNLTLKILLLVVLLGALAGGIALYTLSQLRAVDREYSAVLGNDARAAVLVGAALLDLSDANRLVYGVLVEQEEAAIRAAQPRLDTQEVEFLRKLDMLRPLIPAARPQLVAVEQEAALYFQLAARIVDAASRWRGDRALEIIDNDFHPTLRRLRDIMEAVREDAVVCFQRSAEKLAATTKETQRNTTLAAGLVLVIAIGLAIRWSLTNIARPIDRLAEEKAQAEELVRAKSAFLATMSHEIRTPMNGVLGMLQLLSQTPLDAKQHDYVDKAQNAGQLLLDLLNAVLDFSKIEAEKLTIELAPFRVDELMQTMHNVLTSVAKNKPVAIHCQLDPAVPRALLGDALRLQQVLLNLAGNAVKFTERGEVLVSIRLLEVNDEQAQLAFSVKDTGIGIAQEKLQSIFEAFSQADASMSRRFGGTGLGLSISQRLVALMGGELAVESTLGKGSTFSFTLTLGRNADTLALEEANLHHPRVQDTDLAGLRLLLVEDNPLNQQVAAELLARAGAEVVVAEDGQAAIEAMRNVEQAFDAVLMDIQMPGMDGYQTARHLRHDLGVTLPIFAMTANTQASDRAASFAAGMNAHIGKPIDMLKLIATIREHCLIAGASLPGAAPQDLLPVAPSAQEMPEQRPAPSLEGFNLPVALARMDGDISLYQMVVQSFVQEYEQMVSEASEALGKGDRDTAQRKVHTLKGVAGTLGAETLQEMAAEIEKQIRNGAPAESLLAPLAALDARLAQDRITLKQVADHGFQ